MDLIHALRPFECARPLMRFGPPGDGGYLLPDDLGGIHTCFSPGVSRISGFEQDCADRGMEVYMADASVAGPASDHPRFHFTPHFLGPSTGGQYLTLADWVEQSVGNTAGDLMLQMDIESHEYAVILSTPDALLERFRIMVIEFHLIHELWNQPFFEFARSAFMKLLRTHACVHIHPNNYRPGFEHLGIMLMPFMEFTFLRRDRLGECRPATRFPHPLDADCTDRPHIALPRCWYAD
jgi:hypothetical protein